MKHYVEVEYLNKDMEQYERIAWCRECVGKRSVDWAVTLKSYNVVIYSFKEEVHAMLFSLKWTK